MRQILVVLLILAVIGCATPKEPVNTTSEPSSTASAPSLDEQVKNLHNTIVGAQKAIDRTTFVQYYRSRATKLVQSGRVRMSKEKIAQQAAQQFRKLDRNHDKKITEGELKTALAIRAQERKNIRNINPREWNLLDDAF